MVIVFGGTNDYCHGDAPFGKIEDVDRNTFCGSVRCLMDMLVRRYPDAKLIFLTPARRLGDEFPSKSRSAGFPLKCYADAIKEVAKDYPVAVFDTYERLGINPNIDSDRLMYTSDGLHLNDVGHRVLAERLCAFLDSL